MEKLVELQRRAADEALERCVAAFAVQPEVGERLGRKETRQVKAEILI